jgi:formate hydrogenlyase transcriptional activator
VLTEPEVKEAAEEIARDTDGVRRVLNHLKGPFRLMHLATRKATGAAVRGGHTPCRRIRVPDDHSGLGALEEPLIKVAVALTRALDVSEACEAMIGAVERMFDARAAWILLHDPSRNELVTCAYRGAGASTYEGLRLPSDRGIVGLVFTGRTAVFVPDVAREERWFDQERVHASALQSVFTLPLLHDAAALGVIGVDSRRFNAQHPPGAADVERLEGLAAIAAVGIRNAQLFASINEDRQRLRRLLAERKQLRSEVDSLRDEIRVHSTFGTIVGSSVPLTDALEQVGLVAPADTSVLLSGETGTGKELFARVIHSNSRRAKNAFVAVNCAAMPESLIESELFGYERGAFTGALSRKPGKFELADRGTLFLDEVGDLPLPAQAKLLRVLQEREVERVGGTRPVPVNVRLIAATNHDLFVRMTEGQFRPDLFYRLSVFPLHLPPLRDRREDIPQLVQHFVGRFAERLHKPVPVLTDDALTRLLAYEWPGNVRELQNVLERAMILLRGSALGSDLLSFPHVTPAAGATAAAPGAGPMRRPPAEDAPPPRPPTFDEAERRVIVQALQSSGWRISGRNGAAEMLGLKPTTLHAKMKKLGIHRPAATAGRLST